MLLAVPAFANGIDGTLSVSLAPWKTACKSMTAGAPSKCGLAQPLPDQDEIQAELPLAALSEGGTAGRVFHDFRGTISGRLTVYSVMPASDSKPSYLQLRLELISPVRAVCASSIKWEGPRALPPLICAGFDGGNQFGMTGKFQLTVQVTPR